MRYGNSLTLLSLVSSYTGEFPHSMIQSYTNPFEAQSRLGSELEGENIGVAWGRG